MGAKIDYTNLITELNEKMHQGQLWSKRPGRLPMPGEHSERPGHMCPLLSLSWLPPSKQVTQASKFNFRSGAYQSRCSDRRLIPFLAIRWSV